MNTAALAAAAMATSVMPSLQNSGLEASSIDESERSLHL
jgi:hypothetical protein